VACSDGVEMEDGWIWMYVWYLYLVCNGVWYRSEWRAVPTPERDTREITGVGLAPTITFVYD
jgi:hypothetical protein